MKNEIEKARTEIRIKNIQSEINKLVDQYFLAELDVTKNVIKDKIDRNFELIEELKEVL